MVSWPHEQIVVFWMPLLSQMSKWCLIILLLWETVRYILYIKKLCVEVPKNWEFETNHFICDSYMLVLYYNIIINIWLTVIQSITIFSLTFYDCCLNTSCFSAWNHKFWMCSADISIRAFWNRNNHNWRKYSKYHNILKLNCGMSAASYSLHWENKESSLSRLM